ncbi:MAG TPA: TonB-dependent receptor [Bacteroidales bacterium]|nr:TonB-dependent receptor [Bacteroidales bacterium]
MKPFFLLILAILLLPLHLTAETEEMRPATDANIFGHILDATTGEHIPFINILVEGTRIGALTDVTGHYILTNLPVGQHTLVVTGMGFETTRKSVTVEARRTIQVDISVAPTPIPLEEIIITSSPTASGFHYQPTKVFIGEKLQRRGEASFGEMLDGEPGVAMRSLGSAPARPVIRGLDGDRILVLQNGERLGDISETSADHSITLDPLAASRIEVVRGPASLLYGSSALGGVINLMTTDIPDDVTSGTTGVLSLQGASMNDMGAGFGRITHASDQWATSARFSYRQSGEIMTPAGILPGTSMRNYDGAIGFGFNLDNSLGGVSVSLTGQTFGLPVAIDEPGKQKEIQLERQAVHGRWAYRGEGFFDRGLIRFNAARMLQDEVESETEGGITETIIPLNFAKYTLSGTTILQHRPTGIFDRGAVGLNLYAHQKEVGGIEAFTPGEHRFSLGMFTFQEIPLTHIFRLQGGLRIDFQHIGAIPGDLFPLANESRNVVNFSGSVGLNYRPFPGWEAGAQFARSHRNPTINELFANGPHMGAGVFEIGSPQLRDEIGHGGDLFIRYSRNGLQAEIAAFVNHFQNFIIFSPTGLVDTPSGFPVFRYTGDEARLAGGEVSLDWTIIDGLTLGLGADYVRGQRIGNGRENLPFIPPFRYRANIEYDFGWAWLGASFYAASTQNFVAPEEVITQGYNLLGATAGYRLNAAGRHVIILRADNLLNTRYLDHLSRIENRNLLMPGRNFHISYRWFF